MKCPVCKEPNLVVAERQGVEIDYCPECRGVWLDRGELDKIIDRAATASPAPVRPPDDRGARDHDADRHYSGGAQHGYHGKKKKGFLGDLFDFD
jgi:Zn-finger nucleic acid-binding protein